MFLRDRELLDETSDITLNSSWKDVRRLIKDDPRYVKFSSSERVCIRDRHVFIYFLNERSSDKRVNAAIGRQRLRLPYFNISQVWKPITLNTHFRAVRDKE